MAAGPAAQASPVAGRAAVPAAGLAEAAAELARQLLAGDPERVAHSAAVARRAQSLARTVPAEQREPLVAAAWLHDIGYADALHQTGFHPVDGARYLRRQGWSRLVAELVAHHSGARFVAVVRSLEAHLEEFPFDEGPASDLLTVADQTVGPGGRPMPVEERMVDVLRRHGPESPNGRAAARRNPYLLAAARRVADRLERLGVAPEEHRILAARVQRTG